MRSLKTPLNSLTKYTHLSRLFPSSAVKYSEIVRAVCSAVGAGGLVSPLQHASTVYSLVMAQLRNSFAGLLISPLHCHGPHSSNLSGEFQPKDKSANWRGGFCFSLAARFCPRSLTLTNSLLLSYITVLLSPRNNCWLFTAADFISDFKCNILVRKSFHVMC